MTYNPPMAVRNPYPEREGNAFDLLAGPGAFLPAMLQAIRNAQRYVLIEQYLFGSGEVAGRFIEALTACARRGVAVYMLLDHFGAWGLSHADRRRLEESGIALSFYNPVYLRHFFRALPRNHCKLLLVDGEVAYTGGAGISDDYSGLGGNPAWHDVVVAMRGPVVTDWQSKFMHTWRRWAGKVDLPGAAMQPAGGQQGRLMVSLRGLRKYIRKSLLANIRHASGRVWLGTAYWLPGRVMLRALRAAKRRGVDVRLLLAGPINDHPTVYHAGHRYYHFLLRHGIRIFEYQPAFLHAKLYLCDDYSSIGSCNMDRWGLRWNLEANLESGDPGLCADVEHFFDEGFAHCKEITLEEWRARPIGNRFREWLFGYVDLVIERYGENRELHRKTAIPQTPLEKRNRTQRGH